MLVKAMVDMVYRNSLKKAGEVFDYEGKTVPVCCEALAVQPAAKPAEAPKRQKKSDD